MSSPVLASLGGAARTFAVLRYLVVAVLLLLIVGEGLSRFKDIKRAPPLYAVVQAQQALLNPARAVVKATLPTNLSGHDVSFYLLLGLIYASVVVLSIGEGRLKMLRADLQAKWFAPEQLSGDMADALASLALKHGGRVDRKTVLELYAQAKKTLEQQRRELAFLSIDIVDSTGMKSGEVSEMAERDFIQYKKFVDKILQEHGALKSTWTPDGVMTCFETAEQAVESGKQVVLGLKHFNAKVKSIKRDFAVRVGVNAGAVSYDEATPMEEMTDRVIDIAGHMQKHGSTNAVCAAKDAVLEVYERLGMRPTERVVDGCVVYEWRPDGVTA